ncbi:MAG TPA: protein kinase, partial [Nannocystaceae bacterium]|nr:protein kinase [Nannocystaceae bacterium]
MSLGAPHPPPRNPTEGELLRSEALLAQTLAHDSTHAGPVIDLGSDRVGRYAVLSKLGQGGMGAVYTAYDEELDRRVALKLVREPSGVDTLGHARMQREAQAMARLSHPNVVQIYDVGSHEGQIFIAMEFVRGSTLRAWQERHDPATPAGRRAILDMYIQAGRGL